MLYILQFLATEKKVLVPVLAKFYKPNTKDYVEKWVTLFENVNVLQVAIVGLFVLDYQAS